MLALLGHIITFVIAWLIVIVGALGILFAIGVMLAGLISLFLSPFSKKADEFHRRCFESHGPWIWW